MESEKIDIDKLNKVAGLQYQRRNIEHEINSLSAPISTDIGKIKDVYKIFTSALGHVPVGDERKAFVMVVLYIFSPGSLIGRKIRKGVRSAISALFLGKSPSWVSNNCYHLLFYYQTYKEFRCMVDELLSKTMEEI